MVLVDTSVWISHFRKGEPRLVELLENDRVLTHSSIIGELALGNLRKRGEILAALSNLPRAVSATDDEVLAMIEKHDLAGSGISWIDAHLLAAALLSSVQIWSLDRSLAAVADRLDAVR